MITAISAPENRFDSQINKHFARCNYFVIHDSISGSVEFLPNPNKDKIEEAGKKSAEMLHSRGVKQIVSGDFGTRVKALLDRFQIRMIVVKNSSQTVSNIIKLLNQNQTAMPKMDGTGPEGKGAGTGRGLGRCKQSSQKENIDQLGKGMGAKRKAGGGQGKGKRLQSGSK